MLLSRIARRLKSAMWTTNKSGPEWLEKFKKEAWTSSEAASRYVVNVGDSENLTYFVQTTLYVEKIKSFLENEEHILDVGCGTGVLTRALSDASLKVSGMDISESMLEQNQNMLDGRDVDLHVGDIFDLPFEDGSFDGIASRWVLPHFQDWSRSVSEMGRKLKPGGYLFFDFCNTENFELSQQAGDIDVKSFGFCHDTSDAENQGYFYATANRDDMQATSETAGLELVEVLPTGFFVNNASIAAALGGEGYMAYKEGLKQHYMDPGARSFMEWFERFVSPRLPSPMVHGMCVVMRRPEA